MAVKLVTTFHPSSSVVSSVKCRLASRDLEHLVVAKLDRIDVYSLRPHGLQHECGVDVWGRVLCVKALPISGTERSKLALMTSHPDPELVFFSYKELEGGSAELVATKSLSLFERSPREAEFFNDLVVHPSGEVAVASCYVGKLKVIKLKSGGYEKDFDLSLLELNVLSLAFLPSEEDECVLAILHLDYQSRVQLIARDIPFNSSDDVSTAPSTLLHPTSISNKNIPFPVDQIPNLIPVPPVEIDYEPQDEADEEDAEFRGGVLVVGGRKVLFYELSSQSGRDKQKGKMNRLDKMKADSNQAKVKQAVAKQAEREARKRKPTASVDWPWDEVTAWSDVEDAPLRFFIGDAAGELSMLSLEHIRTLGLILLPLGTVSPSTTLNYLTNQTIYVGSHLGDSQLIQITPIPSDLPSDLYRAVPHNIRTVKKNALHVSSNAKGKGKARALDDDMDVDEEELEEEKGKIIEPEGSYLKVVKTFKNIAPINDAILVDTEGSGQNEIITCSGGSSSGALNIVRNGAEFQELANLQGISNINALWPVKNRVDESSHSHLIASTHERSMLFQINDAGDNTTFSLLDPTAARDLVTKEPTIAFRNVPQRVSVIRELKYVNSNWVVQVTVSGVYLLELDPVMGGFTERAKWTPPVLPGTSKPCEIMVASVNASQVFLALNGGRVLVLRFNEGGHAFETVAEKFLGAEVSAVSCQPVDETQQFSTIFLVAYWEPASEDAGTNTSVEVFKLKGKSLVSAEKIVPNKTFSAVVRSLLLYNFGTDTSTEGLDYHSYLLCGLTDGTLAHFKWMKGQLSDQKVVALGHAPIHMMSCSVDGRRSVVAAGNRATVFSFERKRLTHSPVMLKDLSAACILNTQTFKGSLVLANTHGLLIGVIKELGKMSIRSVPMGYDNPQRIIHVPFLRAFAVACTVYQPSRVGDGQVLKGCLKLMDDSSFKVLSQFNCEVDELASALTTFTLEIDGKETAFICAGTTSSGKGRLLVFSTVSSETRQINQEFTLVASVAVNGQGVNSLKYVDKHIVAAVDSAVVSYQLESKDTAPSPFVLKKVFDWNHNYIVQSLGTFNNRIAIADIASSVSLAAIKNGKITAIARDYGPLLPFTVEALSETEVIGANESSNLFTFELEKSMGQKKLGRKGEYYLADLPTKFIRGNVSLDATPNDIYEPSVVFFTSCGRIGVIVEAKDEALGKHLENLQRNLSGHVKGVGAPSHAKFRAPRNTRGRSDADEGAKVFIDGDFLETFLGTIGDKKKVDRIVAGTTGPERLTLPVEEFQRVLETLQNMH
ncbi:hypothetical protein FA15DRAFT_673909 [Coprinopsis marcescibilis]|uniref:Uncharacterized protein n=1 Tax=Coprinopsis marcescibilis TaxID=230819 RepID=A0A5C3KIM6_COPMA|nr:hypothetical protein FA15DRAFT_673909 [Coprinopsis marcescibilis]